MGKSRYYIGVFLSLLVLAGCTAPANERSGTTTDQATDENAVVETVDNSAPAVETVRPEGVAVLNVRTASSDVEWRAKRVLRDSKHNGAVPMSQGEIWLSEDESDVYVGGYFVLDMVNLVDEDIENDAMREKFERHLKSPDFFDVEQYPEAWLLVTVVEVDDDEEFVLTGDLTIKGTTKEISFPADIVVEEGDDDLQWVEAITEITINRADFDVRYGSETFFDNLGDSVIADEIEFEVSLVTE